MSALFFLRYLVRSTAPSLRSIGTPTYRSLQREKATYPGRLEGYVPYAANHEPPDQTATEQRARIIARRVSAVAEERAA
ncbi:hypothetical protein ASF53_07280 [Methylobacterium sp. Leaf123]|nr:hypothetical protein ASF53_07280 [Methylobacterium sp. Leaf123]